MPDIYTLIDKAGLALAVLLMINFQVLPELRAIRRDLWTLTNEIAKGNGHEPHRKT